MNASFGIDHPLIAVNDIDGMRARLISLGFNMTVIGKHPWGTSTSLAMFDGCLIEIMGIYDDKLLDETPAGDFRFGRHVYRHLQDREGIALTALHSTDSVRDAAKARDVGFSIAGHLEFGRDVILPDGGADRTRTTLALLPDAAFPRLSFFLCQQHRPDLIYVPEWLQHPNSVNGICGVTIWAEAADQLILRTKFEALYGPGDDLDGGFAVATANGPIRVLTRAAVEAELGALPKAVATAPEPSIVGMDFRVGRMETLLTWVRKSGLAWHDNAKAVALTDATKTGNTLFRFMKTTDA